jgi:hypothetical protein
VCGDVMTCTVYLELCMRCVCMISCGEYEDKRKSEDKEKKMRAGGEICVSGHSRGEGRRWARGDVVKA